MRTLTENQVHSLAVHWTASIWQNERAEVAFSALLGQLPREQNGSPVYVVYVQGTAQDRFGEHYPLDQTVTIRLSEKGLPIGRPALDREVWQAERYSRGLAGVECGC